MANIKSPQPEAKATYARLETNRKSYIQRAIQCAAVTIPSLFPSETRNGSTKYTTPYQSIGARGLNNLASKLLLALLPPNSPFFRLTVDDATLLELVQQEGARAEVEEVFSSIERTVMNYIETQPFRVTTIEALKQLIVSGNAMLFLPPKENGVRLYKLNAFVVERDGLGNVLQHVAKEQIHPMVLPEDLRRLLGITNPEQAREDINVYTHVKRVGDHWVSYQEAEGKVLPGYEQTFPLDKSPWIPLRWTKIDGEDYGRGFVEEYLGDLSTLESLSKAVERASLAASKIVFLVNPNSFTNVRQVSAAHSGDFVPGKIEDIGTLQLNKYADLQVAKATCDSLETRLSYAFMLNSAVQRGGERVTAQEIRYVAGELEDTLGGVYSILSQELQLPLVQRIMTTLTARNKIPHLPPQIVNPMITTGLEALGRGHDLNKLRSFTQMVNEMGPQAAMCLNQADLIKRFGTSLGIDMSGLVKTAEQIQQEQQMMQMQAMQQQMMQSGIPMAANVMGDIAKQQLSE